ncbi:MAG: T9SS type A sorting domain-containing protein, partial [Saprospiraceae bacterium]
AGNLTTDNLPDKPDYVLPGDTDGDKKANVYDLLDIGLGYLTSGAPRPNASVDWVPQFAANWPDQLPETLNFKHFDCDGDGMVLDLDADLIEPHYSPIDSTAVPVVPGKPEVWLEFEADTITVDANNPAPLSITANVMVGSEIVPALGLHGLAFALMYPEYVEHDPEVDYKNDFFGTSNHILWLPKDNYNRRQLDLGFTEKYESSSGSGRIATVTFRSDFIIIIDIIEREVGDIKPFAVPIRGLKAIDANGQILEFGTPALQDTLWIKLLQTSSLQEKALDGQVTVYPNPASEEVRILTGDLEVEHLEVVNPLGQVVYSATPTAGRVQRLQVADWPVGLYSLRLQTTQGLAEKKLMVQRGGY